MELKAKRIAANMTQEDLSKAASVSRVAIARYESGTRTPTVDVAARIARALNCSIDDLMKEGKP